MKLTTRFILTLLVVAVPVTALFTMWRIGVEDSRAHEDRIERFFARAAPRAARQCERLAGDLGEIQRRRPNRRRFRPNRPPRHEPERGDIDLGRRGRAFRAFAYDETFTGASDAPEVPAAIREKLADADVAHLHEDVDGARGASAFRLNDTGECSFVVLFWNDRPGATGPGSVARRLVVTQSLVLVFALILTGLLVGLPLVRRIRRLTNAVEASPTDDDALDESGALEWTDELGDLGRAYRASLDRITQQIRELEERDKALEAYIGNTTHDLAIPLTVVQHRLRKLQKRTAGEDLELVKQTLEESSYIAALIANMAAAARLEAGEAHLTFHEVSLDEIVERVAGRLKPIADAKGVNFNFAIPPESVKTEGDSTLIEQALSNLTQNAIQYVGSGGNVVVLLEPEPDGFRLEVFDDGPGIDPNQLERVLERSVRGDSVRTRNEGGSGFGLAIVREVIAQHGWSLDLSNREEGGLRALIQG